MVNEVHMSKRIVVALGGNAILHKDASAQAQQREVRSICQAIAGLVQAGYEVIITHGNGPQVGNLHLQHRNSHSVQNPQFPMDSLVAMTQGSLGYWLQNALGTVLREVGCAKPVVSLITQVEVDSADPAFATPNKPIGPFLTEQEAAQEKEVRGGHYMEDAGRGWRRAVPSPKPIHIVEKEAIQNLLDSGTIIICGGGGGIPVVKKGNEYHGLEAVIDKDLVAELLAIELEADTLLILTGVDNVCVDFGKPTQRPLYEVDTQALRAYRVEGQFPPGSMLPKIDAAIRFAESGKSRQSIITSIQLAGRLTEGVGTRVFSKQT